MIHLCCNIRADSREGEGKAKLLSVQFAQVRFKIICKLYFVFQASFKYKDYFLQPMMNYVLDRNADVRQVCLILVLVYRGISHCVMSRRMPYDVKRFCFTGCVLRMWSDGAVWRRGIHYSLYRSVEAGNFCDELGNEAKTLFHVFKRPIWKWKERGESG